MLHIYDFQVWLSVAAFLAFLVLKFWKCSKMWPSISKWTYTCQKNLKIQVRKYSAFDLAFLTFVGLFKILLRSLRCKKSGGMQESCTLAFYHQKQFSLKISHFESVWLCKNSSFFKISKSILFNMSFSFIAICWSFFHSFLNSCELFQVF